MYCVNERSELSLIFFFLFRMNTRNRTRNRGPLKSTRARTQGLAETNIVAHLPDQKNSKDFILYLKDNRDGWGDGDHAVVERGDDYGR